ncbi:MAG: ArsR/SmtB family transcription factor [Lachnospiraceae bacterium]
MGISSHATLYNDTLDLVPLFNCLGDESRIKILTLLSDHGPMNVTQITEQMDLSRPAVSHHLQQLKIAGFVDFKKRGTERFYRIKFLWYLEKLQKWTEDFKEECRNLE